MKFLSTQIIYLLGQPHLRGDLGRLAKLLALVIAMVAVFAVLFHLLMLREGQTHTWFTGVYWTLTVMSTLGFGDITFHSDLGRVFSVIVMMSGLLMLMVVLPFAFIRFFYAPWLEAQLNTRAPRAVPAGTRGHVILCAYCTVARELGEKLSMARIPYYVLEKDPMLAAAMVADGVPVITGDPEAVGTWTAVNVASARAVVANLGDAQNTNIILTVRQVAADLDVFAFAESEDAVDILEMSGATQVLPLKQRLGEFLANRVNSGSAHARAVGRFQDLVIAEFPVHHTPLVGRTIRDIGLRQRLGCSVVGVWERGKFAPAQPDMVLTEHSVAVVIGTEAQIMELNTFLVIYDTNDEPTLVIGGGRVGRATANALRANDVKVHVIERDPTLAEPCIGVADRVIVGDATARKILAEAGLEKAPAVVLTTNDDSTNIFLAIYCRRLSPDIRIISRITHERNLEAIHRAGADFVLSYASLGAEAAFSILEDRAILMFGAGFELFTVPVPTALVGRTLTDSSIGARCGLNVVAVKEPTQVVGNPLPAYVLTAGSELLMLGTHEQHLKFLTAFKSA